MFRFGAVEGAFRDDSVTAAHPWGGIGGESEIARTWADC